MQNLAKFLQRRVRQTDVMGRLSEDVVALVLEQLTKEDAVRLLNRLRDEFSALEHRGDGGVSLKGTVAAGAAMAGSDLKTLKDWLDRADAALKTASQGSGTGVVMA